MAQKSDFYEVLGVPKTATVEEIKSAYRKIAFANHPDKQRAKSDAEKASAAAIYQAASEAHEVLTDTTKRSTYDKFGHTGLENLKNGQRNGAGYTEAAGETTSRRAYTDEDTDSFFRRRMDENDGSGSSTKSEDISELRRKAAEERQRAREAARGTRPSPSTTPSVTETFREVSEGVGEAASHLKNATVPLDVLERFRDNLKDFLGEVDAAIERSRKNGGPGPKP